MLCASAWVGSTMADPRYGQRIFVYDEARRIICGTAVIAVPLRIGGNAVIGDGVDIASAADFETHRLSG